MSAISVPHRPAKVKRSRRKFDRFISPDPATIPALWHELATMADIAPSGERAGIHRQRSRLLAGVEPWRLPEVLDRLTAEASI